MIKLSDITKSYEGGEILSSVNLVINTGDKVGLVGQNGSGKSTLIKIMVGELTPDRGSVHLDKGDVIDYLPQAVELAGDETVRDFLMEPYRGLESIKHRMEQLEAEMARPHADIDGQLAEYGELQTEFEAKGGYSFEDNFERVLGGLGLDFELQTSMSKLSGGQKARVAIARMLLKQPTIFVLDEPLIWQLNEDPLLHGRVHLSLGIVTATTGQDNEVSSAQLYVERTQLTTAETACKYLGLVKVAKQLGFQIENEFMIGPWCAARHPNVWMVEPEGELYKCACDLGRRDRASGDIFGVCDDSAILDLTRQRLDECLASGCELVPVCGGGCLFDFRVKAEVACRKEFLLAVNKGLLRLQTS